MYVIVVILLFLLIISLINSYLFFYKENHIPNIGLIDISLLPQNIGFTNYVIFYNKNDKYNMCHKTKKDLSNKSKIQVMINDIMKNFYEKYHNDCFIIADNKNSSNIDIEPYLENINKF